MGAEAGHERLAEKPAANSESLPPLPKTHVWGIDYSIVDMPQALDYIDAIIRRRQPEYAITANLNYAMLCEANPRLAEFTRRAAMVLCDGMPILWRSYLNATRLPERVAGADLIFSLAEHCARKGYRLFLMGGAAGIAQTTADRLQERYPGLVIAGIETPPFRPLTAAEHTQLCDRIRGARADVLLVAFGQPKGEYWIEENYRALQVPLSIQLGASFDFVAGNARRAPVWLQRIGLEWCYRSLHDPKRLIPRYLKNAFFLARVLRKEVLQATQG